MDEDKEYAGEDLHPTYIVNDWDKMDDKSAIILNYSMMCGEIHDVIAEKVNFMRQFFVKHPEFSVDDDLLKIGNQFGAMLVALRELDSIVNKIGDKLKWIMIDPNNLRTKVNGEILVIMILVEDKWT